MTPNEHRALEIVREHGPIRPHRFAVKFFPRDHPGFHRATKCGPYGVRYGGGTDQWCGGYLGKLRKKGWIAPRFTTRQTLHRGKIVSENWWDGYVLTKEGRDVLNHRELDIWRVCVLTPHGLESSLAE